MTPCEQAVLKHLAIEELPGGSGGLTGGQVYLKVDRLYSPSDVRTALDRLHRTGKVWSYTARTRYRGWQVFYFLPSPEARARDARKRA